MNVLSYDVDYVEKITKLPLPKQEKLIRYYSKLSPLVRLEAHARQRQYSTEWRNNARAGNAVSECYDAKKSAENFYCGLIVALADLVRIEEAVSRGRSLTEEELALCNSLRVEKLKTKTQRKQRKSPKRNMIETHFFLIRDLLAQDLSWRQISQYQEFKGISFVYLHKEYLKELSRRDTTQKLISE